MVEGSLIWGGVFLFREGSMIGMLSPSFGEGVSDLGRGPLNWGRGTLVWGRGPKFGEGSFGSGRGHDWEPGTLI